MDAQTKANGSRKDIVATQSEALSRAIEKAGRAEANYVPPAARSKRLARARDDKRLAIRKDLVESPQSDPNGFERIIGESDLMSINFLDRGRRAAAAVCRIKVPSVRST